MDIILQLEKAIQESRRDSEYGVRIISKDMLITDQILNRAIDEYLCLSKADKIKIRKQVTQEQAWLLLCFSIRMATYSLRLSNQRYFTNGLIALGMTLGIIDEREVLIVLVLFTDVQSKKMLSYKECLKNGDEDFIQLLDKFLKRSDRDKSLKCMGYICENDKEGNLIYTRTW